MNETLNKFLTAARGYFETLSPGKRWAIGALAIGASAVLGVLIIASQRDPYQTLYTDLQREEARAVVKKLGETGIPYQLVDDGTTVNVPASHVASARMQLAKAGLPSQDVVGFEKFDGSTLGMSSYVQRIQYVRAVQGELTRSIQRLASVKHARVHISVPPKKTFLEDEDPPKASVVLELRDGMSLQKGEVAGIAHLVASAVEGLKVNQVTIVDTKGAFLHRPDDGTSPAVSSALLDLQRNIEREYEKRIEEILLPVVGLGKVRAKVTAEIDPSRTNTTEESYDPDKAVVRSTLKNNESFSGIRPNPSGIAGSRSNLPGAETAQRIPASTNASEKDMSNTNYAIPRKVTLVDKPSGNIKRLTVAVVVDGNYSKAAAGGAETFVPRGEEELKRLKDLVANAVGYDDERRDSLTVSSLPFRNSELNAAPEVDKRRWWEREETLWQLAKYALAGVATLFFLLVILRPLSRWAFAPASARSNVTTLPKTVAELEAAQKEEGLAALGKRSVLLEDVEPLEKQEEGELRKRILERMTNVPRKGLRIVQDWIDEDVQKTPEEAEAA